MNKNINRYYPIAIGYNRLMPPLMVDVLHRKWKLRQLGTETKLIIRAFSPLDFLSLLS
jgi:hypothetical protein